MCGPEYPCDAEPQSFESKLLIRGAQVSGCRIAVAVVHDTNYFPGGSYRWSIHRVVGADDSGECDRRVSATDPNAVSTGESKRYMVGPSVEGRFFGAKIGLELDAIYRRLGYSYAGDFGPPPPDYQGPAPITKFYIRSRANSWEMPLIGKYYFRGREERWRPFLGAGFSLRMQWWNTDSTIYRLGGIRRRTAANRTARV